MGRRLHRFLKSEQLESRRPLAADLAALDINDDMSVTALDALLIINEINRSADSVSTAEAEGQLDCDTNSDGVVTPIDVLNVVNQINSGIIAVPTDSADTTTSDSVDTVPTDSGGDSVNDTNPGDDTVVSTPDDNATDDSDSDDSDSDTTDDSLDDSADGTDGSDDSGGVVNQPTDGTDDTTADDTSDDTSDDDTTDDESSTNDDSHCDHDHAAGSTIRSGLTRGGHHGRGGLLEHFDTNGDGALSSDEVPQGLWDRLSEADADASDSVTQDELQAYLEAQRVAAVEAFFEQLDSDGSGDLTSADVSRVAWRFLSRADANNDGAVTVDELLSLPLPGRWGGH